MTLVPWKVATQINLFIHSVLGWRLVFKVYSSKEEEPLKRPWPSVETEVYVRNETINYLKLWIFPFLRFRKRETTAKTLLSLVGLGLFLGKGSNRNVHKSSQKATWRKIVPKHTEAASSSWIFWQLQWNLNKENDCLFFFCCVLQDFC